MGDGLEVNPGTSASLLPGSLSFILPLLLCFLWAIWACLATSDGLCMLPCFLAPCVSPLGAAFHAVVLVLGPVLGALPFVHRSWSLHYLPRRPSLLLCFFASCFASLTPCVAGHMCSQRRLNTSALSRVPPVRAQVFASFHMGEGDDAKQIGDTQVRSAEHTCARAHDVPGYCVLCEFCLCARIVCCGWVVGGWVVGAGG